VVHVAIEDMLGHARHRGMPAEYDPPR